ncbi:potassium transporter Kup [Microbulbifer sp. OS29]|uniref:Probable potassium transport system protein Kup n=1 Tax=Microbulbifer okhotskensis TaxID=2926617 RepID=A0A9X2EVC0_9GAMM|nr:potassium transporter Kup [Microbulbifer okhotskensis]MCO1336623.1 potassium transporter Kup [Microbulbifer okhotskensis]
MESPSEGAGKHWILSLAALGVVFGDIGTSPLYAFKLIFHPRYGIPLTAENIIGGVSAVFWALTIIVTVKYVTIVMRLDNRGEGGIMALMTLALEATKGRDSLRKFVIGAGICGAALFFGDAVITPAISVLSAIEGLEIGSRMLKPFILPISVGVLLGLFFMQRFGIEAVGKLFGPITAIWFLILLIIGASWVIKNPAVLHAINPLHALKFLSGHGIASFWILGAVLLVFTGGEALYTDMGHFGRRPIRIAWLGLVLPALMLNYMGQGALLMLEPSSVDNPFYRMYPNWALYPIIVLATAATCIASQACIAGTFSLAKQGIQLGLLPRLAIHHTSSELAGQIYMPGVNFILMIAVLMVTLTFGSSMHLASAYGVSVSGAMLITSCIAAVVYRYSLKYNLAVCILGGTFFVVIDFAFFTSNLAKIGHGGWFSVSLAAFIAMLMITWRSGRQAVNYYLQSKDYKLAPYLNSLFKKPPLRVPGTAIFLSTNQVNVPHALIYNLKHNSVLHEKNLFLTVTAVNVPKVMLKNRVIISKLREGCFRLILRYGYMEHPDVERTLQRLNKLHLLDIDPAKASFFICRYNIFPVTGGYSKMANWRERIFAAMVRNSSSAIEYYRIPANRTVEVQENIMI